ncbi:MAG: chitobiase/beta-hexosaminidase C-terminal domain-containing protein [Proteobacteria bacterium]|nr:chitobiase/beta-hexosaminidase C-terminal domain-containing protein [Pseudomonadota bacterium]
MIRRLDGRYSAVALALLTTLACGVDVRDSTPRSPAPVVKLGPLIVARAARGVVSASGSYRQETLFITSNAEGDVRVALGDNCATGITLVESLAVKANTEVEVPLRAEGALAAERIYTVQVCLRTSGGAAARTAVALRVDNQAPTVTPTLRTGAYCGAHVLRFHCDECTTIAYATGDAVTIDGDGAVLQGTRYDDAAPVVLTENTEVSYAAIDRAGNVSAVGRTTLKIGVSRAPVISNVLLSDPIVSVDGAGGAPAKTTLSFEAEQGLYFSVRLGTGSCATGSVIAQGTTHFGGTTSLQLAAASLSEGRNRLAVCVRDGDGCTGAAPFALEAREQPKAFAITSLSSANCTIVDHNSITGDDRGGIAVSGSRLFVGGDGQTAVLDLELVQTPVGLSANFDTIFGDLESGRVYVLDSGAGVVPYQYGPFNALVELDASGGIVGRTALSTPIPGGTPPSSVHAARGGALIVANGRVFRIAAASGFVEDLGAAPSRRARTCEDGIAHGVAEQIAGQWWIAYRDDATQSIVRTRISDGQTQTIAAFTDLGDLCSFTVSPGRNRWYFHFENNAQFGSGSESVGFCDAAF